MFKSLIKYFLAAKGSLTNTVFWGQFQNTNRFTFFLPPAHLYKQFWSHLYTVGDRKNRKELTPSIPNFLPEHLHLSFLSPQYTIRLTFINSQFGRILFFPPPLFPLKNYLKPFFPKQVNVNLGMAIKLSELKKFVFN